MNSAVRIRKITAQLIAEVTGCPQDNFDDLQVVDLHLRDESKGKIRKIENMILTPNVKQLNLSYNVIMKIEGLSRLRGLIELNLAENAIRKIENIETLHLLERLNLSGNQIQRIPESIGSLKRLRNLRLARNELDVVKDLAYLSPLTNLSQLRIDENPFSQLEHTNIFTIYCIPSLTHLNGSEITQEEKDDASTRFAVDDIAALRRKLAIEQRNLATLKREVNQSPEKRIVLERSRGTPIEKNKLDQANRQLAYKLDIINAAEAEVDFLQQRIRELSGEIEILEPSKGDSPPTRDHPGVGNSPAKSHSFRLLPSTSAPNSPIIPANRPITSRTPMTPITGATPNQTILQPFHSETHRSMDNKADNRDKQMSLSTHQQQKHWESSSEYSSEVGEVKLDTRGSYTGLRPSERPSPPPLKRDNPGKENRERIPEGLDSDPRFSLPVALGGGGERSPERLSNLTEKYRSTRELLPRDEEMETGGSPFMKIEEQSEKLKKAKEQIRDLTGRIERLAEKLLVSEQGRTDLQVQLRREENKNEELKEFIEKNKKREESTGAGRRGLVELEKALEDALSVASTTNEELKRKSKEVELLEIKLENEKTANKNLQETLNNSEVEKELFLQELTELRKQLSLTSTSTSSPIRKRDTPAGSSSVVDAFRARMAQIELSSSRTDAAEQSVLIDQLKSELEDNEIEMTKLRGLITENQEEITSLKTKNGVLREQLDNSKKINLELESEKIGLNRKISESIEEKEDLNLEKRELKLGISILEKDLESLIKAKKETPKKPNRHPSPFIKKSKSDDNIEFLRTQKKREKNDFFEDFSTDSDMLENDKKPDDLGKKSIKIPNKGIKKPFSKEPIISHKFNPNHLEKTAVDVMTNVFLEEITESGKKRKNAQKRDKNPNPVDKKTIKDACIKAVLRLIHSSKLLNNENNENKDFSSDGSNEDLSEINLGFEENIQIPPFHVLGSRDFLSKLVADAHANIAEIEDSNELKQEIKQLEKIIREMELNIEAKTIEIQEKEHNIKKLNQHCDDAKSQANSALSELENITKQLTSQRNEKLKNDSEFNLLRKEHEITKQNLQETIEMNKIEQKNLKNTRDKIMNLKEEQHKIEDKITKIHESFTKEEEKLRLTKFSANDQLRLLQIDLEKISSDFRLKQESLEEFKKYQNHLKEDENIRIYEYESKLNMTIKQYNSENKKLNEIKNDLRLKRLEIEQFISKKRQIESEVEKLKEIFSSEQSKFEMEELIIKSKLENYEKQLNEAEKNIRIIKEKSSALEGEQVLLRHNVEELRRQQQDLEKTNDQRRRSAEEELASTQHQAQVALRAARLSSAQADQKRAELDSLTTELRTMERRHEDLKRATRDLETRDDALRETSRTFENELEKLRKETITAKKELDEYKHQQQLLKTTLEQDNKMSEDFRRRLLKLQNEEESLSESDSRLRNSWNQARKGLLEAQVELEEIRGNSERERRALADTKTRKAVADGELQRLEEELRFAQERISSEGLRYNELESSLIRSREEYNRLQKDIMSLEKKVEESLRREQELRNSENTIKSNCEKLKLELEGLSSQQVNEKYNLEQARSIERDYKIQLKTLQEEHLQLQKQTQLFEVQVETLKSDKNHLELIKIELNKEIQYLREAEKMEMKKAEKSEKNYEIIQARLNDLKNELNKMEEQYEKTKNLSFDEEVRLKDQKRALSNAMNELSRVEKSVQDAQNQMNEERHKIVSEIGELGKAKESAQNQIIMLSEAQKRFNRINSNSSDFIPTPVTSSSPKPTFSTSPVLSSMSNYGNMKRPTSHYVTSLHGSLDKDGLNYDRAWVHPAGEVATSGVDMPLQNSTIYKSGVLNTSRDLPKNDINKLSQLSSFNHTNQEISKRGFKEDYSEKKESLATFGDKTQNFSNKEMKNTHESFFNVSSGARKVSFADQEIALNLLQEEMQKLKKQTESVLNSENPMENKK